MRVLEAPYPLTDRAGECSFLVAEELGLQEVLGERCAVHRDERLVRTLRCAMQILREDLLARPSLA